MVVDPIQEELKQRDNLSTSEKRNIFIEAGAGAGKSTSLVDRTYYSLAETVEAERIRALISHGKNKEDIVKELSDITGCTDKEIAFRQQLIKDIDDIINGKVEKLTAKDIYAITFTNKATEELRNKIVKKLQDKKDCTDEEIWRKEQILGDIKNIHISTIHKFCEDILKENAIKTGLSPNFAPVIDDEEKEIKDRVIRNYFRNFRHWSSFEKYEVIGLKKKDVKDALCSYSGILNSLLSTADRVKKENVYRCPSFKGDGLKDFRDSVVALLEAADSFIEDNPKKDGKPYSAKGLVSKAGYAYGQTDEERDNTIKNLMKIGENDWYKELNDKAPPVISRLDKDLFDDAYDTFAPLFLNIIQKRNNVYISVAQLCVDYGYELYEEYIKDRDNDVERVTSNDLVYKTYILLKKKADVLEKASNKIKRLFIDEYQDTDSLQYEIAKLIAGNRSDCLYLVGDPKQSIYRFRGAEPDVFFETKEEFKNDPVNHALYDLNINFRSNSKIIEWVNSRYSSIGLIDSNIGYNYIPMLFHPKNEIKKEDFEDEKKLTGFYSFNSVDEESIKDLILYIKENFLIREGKEYREVKFADFMVLMEDHKHMPTFVETFTKNNIPTLVFGESNFFNTLMVRSFIRLFEAILVDSDNSLAQVEAVFFNICPSLYKDKTLQECGETTKGLLNSLRNKTNGMNAYGKAVYLVEHMSLLAKEKHIYEDFEVNFAASKIYQMIETIFSKGFYNGNELIDEFNKFLATSVERESLIQDDNKAIMLINLHKAKGLEAPIVLWVSTKTDDKNADGISTAYKNKMLYPSYIINYVRKSVRLQNEVADLKKDEEFEVVRKEYVAVTRPGEAFIFADTEKNKSMFHGNGRDYKFNAEDVVELSLPSKEDIEEIPTEEPCLEKNNNSGEKQEKPQVVPLVNNELNENADKSIPLYQGEKEYDYQIGSTSPKSTSPSSLEASSSSTRERLRREAGPQEASNRPKSNDVGTILHRALEIMIKDEMSPESSVKCAIEENADLVPSYDNGEFEKFFLTCVTSFNNWFNGDGYALYPEFGFSYYDGENINNGSIDLLMVGDKECIIIDYKSDEAEFISDDATFETTLVEKYKNQLDGYESVVATLFPGKSIKKKIVYFRRYNPEQTTVDVKCLDL